MSPAFASSTPISLRPSRPLVSPTRTPKMSVANIHIGDVNNALGAAVTAASSSSIASHGRFRVALSGGSLPRLLAEALAGSDVALDKWDVFLADERIVPLDHADSNYKEIRAKFPALEVVPINPDLAPEECAKDYQEKVVGTLGEDAVFDAVLLGLGPDGHTCSLFPGHALLEESERIIAPITDSPKPPPERVTLTLPVLNRAKAAMFVCTGAGKAPVVKDILENPDSKLPGHLVKPSDGSLEWFLDEGAAGDLKKPN